MASLLAVGIDTIDIKYITYKTVTHIKKIAFRNCSRHLCCCRVVFLGDFVF